MLTFFADKDILPYLPTLMEHMLTTLKSANSTRAKELAISAIGATGWCLIHIIYTILCLK